MTRYEAAQLLYRVHEGITDDAWDDVITAMAGYSGGAWNRQTKEGYHVHPDITHFEDCNKCDLQRIMDKEYGK